MNCIHCNAAERQETQERQDIFAGQCGYIAIVWKGEWRKLSPCQTVKAPEVVPEETPAFPVRMSLRRGPGVTSTEEKK